MGDHKIREQKKKESINELKQPVKSKKKDKKIKLTEGQAIALDAVLKFISNGSDRTFALFGYAGVGKTFLTKLIIDHCYQKDLKVVLAAPTNKAAKVLSQTTGEEAITIAKMLGLRPKIDQTTGKEIYTRDSDAKTINLENYDLVILDETSMIGSELMALLSQQLTLFSAKFLFLGDPAQLPPVGEDKSPVFAQIQQYAKLTEVVRHSGAILNWATALRRERSIAPIRKFTDNQMLLVLKEQEFSELLLDAFTSKDFKKVANYCRILAWTNACVARWNQRIRGAIFGEKALRFMPGERLIATAACTSREKDSKNPASHKYTETVILSSSGEVEVIETHPEKRVVEYGLFEKDIFHYWLINAQDEEGALKQFRVLDTTEETRVKQMLQSYAQQKQWDNYWGLKRAFHPLDYAYALTVHRAQGSTFQRVFLDFRNLMMNRKLDERKKLLYTAATRASEQMIVLD